MSTLDDARVRIRGTYAIADADAAGGDPVRLAAIWLDAGVRLLQLRAKSWSEQDILRAAREIVARAAGATVILNDHAHLVAAAGAHGVHVGQTDGETSQIRAHLGPGRLLGRSLNHLDQLPSADGADYVAFGPLFPTTHLSRPKAVQGLDALAQLRPRVPVPLVGIGGITLERLPAVRAAGVDAWALIGAVAGAADPAAAARAWVTA